MKSLVVLISGKNVFKVIFEQLIKISLIFRTNQSPNVNIPLSVDNERGESPGTAKLNLGAIVALGAFGGFVFLAAVITTIVIVVRR